MTGMKFVVWKEELSVGVAELDQQHAQLMEVINDLYSAMIGKQQLHELNVLLERIVHYTETHFADEEEFLRQHSYPQYAPHKQTHEMMKLWTRDLAGRWHCHQEDVAQELLHRLKDWWLNHIQHMDLQYSEFLKQQGQME